ncbi:hypothetical protein T05_6951 [Trichinella murrelli]|uniref:Uncharacterized protein n=1 Tax=Trichinella murrelli TaxID=144512 RepID=A0A0V0UC47_9BILA|nr:hypothetical protein T05_6951 [Trichinella murrelli]
MVLSSVVSLTSPDKGSTSHWRLGLGICFCHVNSSTKSYDTRVSKRLASNSNRQVRMEFHDSSADKDVVLHALEICVVLISCFEKRFLLKFYLYDKENNGDGHVGLLKFCYNLMEKL